MLSFRGEPTGPARRPDDKLRESPEPITVNRSEEGATEPAALSLAPSVFMGSGLSPCGQAPE